jgi:hypothetical protein
LGEQLKAFEAALAAGRGDGLMRSKILMHWRA